VIDLKALTVWQPWASLLAGGQKKFETRSWATKYRGPIAIHAGLGRPILAVQKSVIAGGHRRLDCDENIQREDMLEALVKAFEDYATIPADGVMDYLDELPLGCIVATGVLVGCHEIDGIREMSCAPTEYGCWDCNNKSWIDPSDDDLMFGNWNVGNFAWEIKDIKRITPIPFKGQQGLWEWSGR